MTITFARTNKVVADQANPNDLPDILRKFALGSMFEQQAERTINQAASASMTLSPPCIPGTLMVRASAVGTAAAGVRTVGDSGSTPSATVVRCSADGTTLTFEGTVTAAVVSYIARPGATAPVDLAALFAT